jgi:DNA invertase Pin-like site-specific DNA recombinase
MKKAAIYIRVSTTEQEIGLQETELREFADRRGGNTKSSPIEAKAVPRTAGRFESAAAAIAQEEIDVLVVWALDRLARSLRQLLTISEECKALGVDLVSIKQAIDTTLPAGRLTFQVLGQSENSSAARCWRTRVVAGMAQARRSGKHIGRPARRRFSRAEIEKIRLLRSQGKSVRQLAKE